MRTCHVLSTLLALTSIALPGLAGGETAAAELQEDGAAPEPGVDTSPAEETAESPPPAPTIEDNVEALSSRDPAARIAAARALGATGDTNVAEPLIEVLSTEPTPEVRAWIVRSLAELRAERGQEAIVRVAHEDPDERVRALAARLSGMAAPPIVGAAEQSAAPAGPAVRLDYGDPTPEERAAQRRPGVPGRGYAISGWTVFGTTYFTCFLAGVVLMTIDGPGLFWPLIVPGIGPAILGGMFAADSWGAEIPAALCFIATAVQAAGIALLAVGHSRMRSHRREGRRAARPLQIAVLPTTTGGAPGLAAVGVF